MIGAIAIAPYGTSIYQISKKSKIKSLSVSNAPNIEITVLIVAIHPTIVEIDTPRNLTAVLIGSG